MATAENQERLQLAERALREAKDAERWAQHALSNDPNGNAHQAWTAAGRAVRELKKLVDSLRHS